MSQSLHDIAKQMVADHKGLLAADESVKTATKRLDSIGMESTDETRRQYRNLFLSTPELGDYISGVILFEETLDQQTDDGTPFLDVLQERGVLPGIKVDKGAHDLAGFPGEKVTEGLDKLRERLKDFYDRGCRFTKWRSVITIDGTDLPTEQCIQANAHGLARYAALAQEAGMVPVVEPEVLITGDHDLARSEAVTTATLQMTFAELEKYRVDIRGTILKSSMVISGDKAETQATPDEVAAATMRCFSNSIPDDLPGIVFLSGGQTAIQATENLNAVNKVNNGPWTISFSYARALQGPPLQIWNGTPDNVAAARTEFVKRMQANHAANKGEYSSDME